MNMSGRFTIPMMYANISYLKGGKYMVVEAKTESRKLSLDSAMR